MKLLSTFCCCLAVVCLVFSGCDSGPKVSLVKGVVTLDGQPIENATVDFYPSNGDRGSSGVTNAQGEYTLSYSADKKGARPGEHKVTIKTEIEEEMDYSANSYDEGNEGNSPVVAKGRKELLSPKYYDYDKSELSAAVGLGENVINFDLESK
jgi:hypothetical protein